ncbi:MAG: tRNA pseudouridine(55) synthase TruB [Saprospiraceae bacterium]
MNTDDIPPSRYDFRKGEVLLVNKPKEWTSFDVVNKLRYKIKKQTGVKRIKVGHAGTLDPLATGLLIICTGKMTKQIHTYQGLPKTYTGSMMLGATTASYDAEMDIDQRFPIDHITADLLERTRQQFLGVQQQVPPIFSAIKVDGQPLYKKARKGKEVEIKSRQVEIMDFKLTNALLPEVDFLVECSKGTYIRSLAYDFGKALNSGAYLSNLCRTAIGKYRLEDAWQLDELVEVIDQMPVADPVA